MSSKFTPKVHSLIKKMCDLSTEEREALFVTIGIYIAETDSQRLCNVLTRCTFSESEALKLFRQALRLTITRVNDRLQLERMCEDTSAELWNPPKVEGD